jgi:hypothetical protein
MSAAVSTFIGANGKGGTSSSPCPTMGATPLVALIGRGPANYAESEEGLGSDGV